jgi:hypothetical protein
MTAAMVAAAFLISCAACFGLGHWVGVRHADRSEIVHLAPAVEPTYTAAHGHEHPRSGKWPGVRAAYLREHPTCEACGSKEDLNVHHILPFHLHEELELSPGNLICLCRDDHFWLGHLKDFKAFNPHVREDAAFFLKRIKERRYHRRRPRTQKPRSRHPEHSSRRRKMSRVARERARQFASLEQAA